MTGQKPSLKKQDPISARPTIDDVRQALRVIRPMVHRTPVLTSRSLDERAGCRLFFKCENFQKTGAFKFRGASYAVAMLSKEQAAAGVITHSSGNHAAALACAAAEHGIRARVVMPKNASSVKVKAVQAYGAQITFCEPTVESRETTTESVIRETGCTFIHPYNDDRIIAGQGTAVLELLEEISGLDAVLAPVGGGGLLSGTVIAVKGTDPSVRVFGCEPRNADDAWQSFHTGKRVTSVQPRTIADGLRTVLGDRTFPIIRDLVDDIVLAEESEIVESMRIVFERMKIVIEPSSAVPLAAILAGRVGNAHGKLGIVVSGGTVDLAAFFTSFPSM
jgi:threonine dehydratase